MSLCDAVSRVVMTNGHIHDVKKILRNGADINSTNKMGDTPIIIAAKWYNVDLCLLLLEYHPNLTIKSNSGRNAYFIMRKSEILRPLMYRYILRKCVPHLPLNIVDSILDML